MINPNKITVIRTFETMQDTLSNAGNSAISVFNFEPSNILWTTKNWRQIPTTIYIIIQNKSTYKAVSDRLVNIQRNTKHIYQ